ncbi:unnamed protein product [Cunninghamella echinulata]
MFKSRKKGENKFTTASNRQKYRLDHQEFEIFALDRLQVLKTIETANLRNLNEEEYKKAVLAALDKYLPMKSNLAKENLLEERRKDHISHFVLRLAYCRSDELREWFLRQECALFKFRYEQEMSEDRKRFLESSNLSWKIIDDTKKQQIHKELESCAPFGLKNKDAIINYVDNETYFEVNFEKVLDLVRRRAVYISKGKAYVPISHQLSLVMDEFKYSLSNTLEATARLLPRLEEDDRLKPILLNVEKQNSGKIYAGSTDINESLNASNVSSMVDKHAPLCMRTLNDALHRDKHIKHTGRLQYGLFLKAIGLSVQEALVFWRTAFASVTDDKFQKEYAYNIRHSYGLEGRRTSYAAYNCATIIRGSGPSTGEYHGCPFKHSTRSSLETRLYKDKIPPQHVKEVLDLVQGQHYQLACTKYFEITHPQHEKIDPIEHPNAYYELSIEAEKEKENNESMDVE